MQDVQIRNKYIFINASANASFLPKNFNWKLSLLPLLLSAMLPAAAGASVFMFC